MFKKFNVIRGGDTNNMNNFEAFNVNHIQRVSKGEGLTSYLHIQTNDHMESHIRVNHSLNVVLEIIDGKHDR